MSFPPVLPLLLFKIWVRLQVENCVCPSTRETLRENKITPDERSEPRLAMNGIPDSFLHKQERI